MSEFDYKTLKTVIEFGLVTVCDKILKIIVNYIDAESDLGEEMTEFIQFNMHDNANKN